MARMRRSTLFFLWLSLICGCASGGTAPWVIYEASENYVGQYMGGGAHLGEARRRQEGTWARDYAGLDIAHLVQLRWSHSRHHRQGGIGSY